MRLAYALRDIILEQSRFDVLLDKYASKKKDKKSGKEVKPLMDLSILAQIIFADPTTKKPDGTDESDYSVENLSRVQPGAYTNWLLKHYVTPEMEMSGEVDYRSPAYQKAVIEGRRLFMEDLFKVNGDLKKFTKYKQYFPQDKRDINRIANPTELFNFLSAFQLPEKKQKEIEKKELKKEIRKDREGFSHPGATIEFTGDKWSVIKIEGTGEKQQEAATWFGGFYDYDNGESRWCTSPPNSSYFKTYAKDGPLYVILSNDESGPVGKRTGLPQLRYQFHFPSNQFMDRADSPNSSAAKFIALYGFDEFFASLPDDITNLLFNNKSNETIALDVPSTLGRFKNLEALLLMNCVKTIPNEIGQLSNLSFLALPDNSALKSLPDSLLQLPNLMFVNLKGSKPNLSEAFNVKFGEEGVAGSGFFTKKM